MAIGGNDEMVKSKLMGQTSSPWLDIRVFLKYFSRFDLPYLWNYNPLLITNCSWILTMKGCTNVPAIYCHLFVWNTNDRMSKRNWLKSSPPAFFYLKFKVNNKNDMAAHAFWACFYSSQWPSKISPTAESDAAAIFLSSSFFELLNICM